MSKITHEQIRKSFDRLYKSYETDYFAPFPTRSDLDTIKLFITQQEKLDIFLQKNLELLGLYQYANTLLHGCQLWLQCMTKIKVLETELKESESK